MGNPFKKVQLGQKLEIPAEAFNTFIDVSSSARPPAAHAPAPTWPTTTTARWLFRRFC